MANCWPEMAHVNTMHLSIPLTRPKVNFYTDRRVTITTEGTGVHIRWKWLLYVTPGLKFENPMFCSHGIFFVWISEYKRRPFPYTALTDWFLLQRFNPSKSSGHYMHHQFNIHEFYVLPTQRFVWIWEQTAIISLYNINWLDFITDMKSVYCAVRTGYLYIIQV